MRRGIWGWGNEGDSNGGYNDSQNFPQSAKSLFPVFKILPVLMEFSFWLGDWALGYHSMGFSDCPDIS